MFEGDKLPFHLYLSLCVLFLVTKKRLVLPFGCFLTGLLLGSLSLSLSHTQAIGQKEKRKRKVSHIEPLVSAGGSSLHTPGSLRACEASGAGRSQCAAPGHPVPLCPEVGVYPSPAPAPSIAKAFLTP